MWCRAPYRRAADDRAPPVAGVRAFALVLALAAGCGRGGAAAIDGGEAKGDVKVVTDAGSRGDADRAFAELSSRFLEEYLRREPVAATEAGDHRYDGAWPDASEDGERDAAAFYERTLQELAKIPRADLSPANRVDAAILDNQARYRLFALRELREPEQSPLFYTGLIGDGLDPLLTRSFAPIQERMRSLRGRLEGVPRIVEIAMRRLHDVPAVHAETAVDQNRGLIALFEGELAEHFAKVPDQRAGLEGAAKGASKALKALQNFLEKDVLPHARGDFRLGRERFEKKLGFVLEDEVDAAGLVRAARGLLSKTQDEMVETGKELWPSLFPGKPVPPLSGADERRAFVRTVLDKLADDRPTDATVLDEGKKLLKEATAFVKEHDLVRVPDEPCEVIEMPEYRRGVSIAYCDASGPLEKNAETYYAIAPTPKSWPAARSLSFYREYNRSMLAELTVHEAMPGHFLQLMLANRYRSDVRAVFRSGAFIEGWAVYAESVMAKHGFGGPRVKLMRQKMIVRSCANAVLDHEIHAGAMDEAGALALMTKEAFQEEGEAVGKWRRARLTSAQLSTYFYGFAKMAELRAAYEAKPGFSERTYHDKLLSFGSPPMRQLAELMSQPP